ncbi:MAG TPA: thioredoxin domain-containing protein [Candidatus Binatia bacterium]|nr:thioredoxin domain-containing protein [Candidatus Binatia bacterium]
MLALFYSPGIGKAASPVSTPAAQVGDEIISLEEIQQSLKSELMDLERERFRLIDEKLAEVIADKLLASEAKRRGITVAELIKQEVDAKAAPVSDDEVERFIAANRARMGSGDSPEVKLKVWGYLREQKIAQRKSEYVRALRAQSGVKVFLADPTAIKVDAGKGFARGAEKAPVKIVEFSDFQCPFCKAATTTMHQLLDQYAGKIRWVFRDFPIASIHPLAPKAHEAARCAAEQEKFWQYHDLLFDRAPLLSPAELKQYARELKLDAEAFDRCFDSGKYQPVVAADVAEGQRLGVSGTPAFFINGRLLVGAQPATVFQQMIDSELAKQSSGN